MIAAPATYQPILDLIKELAMKEWIAQGHNMTGKVVEEIEMQVKDLSDKLQLNLFLLPYGVYQDRGVKSADIPYTRGSGAGRSAYIEGLARWVRARMGVGEKKALPIAFAIAQTHKREGMPTKGSYAYSSNGKRKDWFTDAIENNRDLINAKVSQILFGVVESDFTNMIKNLQHEFNN